MGWGGWRGQGIGGGIWIEPAAKTSSLPPKAYTRLMIFAMPGRSLTYVGQGGQQAQPAEDASEMQVFSLCCTPNTKPQTLNPYTGVSENRGP